MTNREFLEAVVEGTVTEEMQEFATEQIEKINARNAKRKETPSKKAEENAPIKEAIVSIVQEAETALTAKEIATAYNTANEAEISTQKASALLTQLANAGVVAKADNAKKQKVYSAPVAE